MREEGRDQLAAQLEQLELRRGGGLADDFGEAAELPRQAGVLFAQPHKLGHNNRPLPNWLSHDSDNNILTRENGLKRTSSSSVVKVRFRRWSQEVDATLCHW